MTGCAVRAKLTVMGIILLVASETIRRCAPELPIGMATFAAHRRMRASQREVREAMIEVYIVPV